MEINAAIINVPDTFPFIGNINIPVPGDHLVLKVNASALNHRDLWIANGQYAGIKYPMVLGSDACVDWNNHPYIINPGLNWGSNPNYHGPDFKILGLPDFGSFADYVAIPIDYLYPKPSHLSIIEAAALPLAGLTAFRALFVRANLQKTDKVFISGIGGGVALFALQFAVANGNDVYVSSSSEEKIEKAIALGAKGGFNYKEEKMSGNILKSVGPMDVIIDSAGGNGFNNLVSITNKGARIAIFGGTAGIMKVTPQKVFLESNRHFRNYDGFSR